ncbi:uncharacterized protein LOC123943225 isoform X2 [Meles meles]|uniref:uncharacterized protein LOC123943225 isoform X2 n=1 Tax=Meles meles TaxID=9662 RepID=UPI001E69F4EC|nr:uncharacterized protein LOC123943225 isoform X2 [Meles meles]
MPSGRQAATETAHGAPRGWEASKAHRTRGPSVHLLFWLVPPGPLAKVNSRLRGRPPPPPGLRLPSGGAVGAAHLDGPGTFLPPPPACTWRASLAHLSPRTHWHTREHTRTQEPCAGRQVRRARAALGLLGPPPCSAAPAGCPARQAGLRWAGQLWGEKQERQAWGVSWVGPWAELPLWMEGQGRSSGRVCAEWDTGVKPHRPRLASSPRGPASPGPAPAPRPLPRSLRAALGRTGGVYLRASIGSLATGVS